MKLYLSCIVLVVMTSACHSQTGEANTTVMVGGPCEGCEAIYEYGDRLLSSRDTLPGYEANEPKLKVSGTVYESDGVSPAKDIILYIYHTNRAGKYEARSNESIWARRHGYIRSWLKTDENGHYTFYTFRPAAYPQGAECEHIHLTVKETDKNEYYIDEIVFDDDPLLTDDKRRKLKNRGGSGICLPRMDNGIYSIKRDIVLGLNIPNYPK